VRGEEARATILEGLARGLNFIDTAPVYGQAEAVIGETLGGRKEGVVVATKAGEYVTPDDVLARDFSEAQIRRSVAESRRRLGVETLDILLLHSPNREEYDNFRPLDTLRRLRDAGEVRFIGVSVGGGGPKEAIALIRGGQVDVLQVAFNLLQPQMAEEVFPLAREAGVGVVARVPLASGFLTGRIGEDHVFADDDYRSKMPREEIARQARRAKAFSSLVGREAGTLAEVALRYALSFEAVSTVIAGAMNPRELAQNLAVSGQGPLSPAALEEIRAVQRAF
jgi:aryl-alcohol dehydrogenase-like predicted oxidoreductase